MIECRLVEHQFRIGIVMIFLFLNVVIVSGKYQCSTFYAAFCHTLSTLKSKCHMTSDWKRKMLQCLSIGKHTIVQQLYL